MVLLQFMVETETVTKMADMDFLIDTTGNPETTDTLEATTPTDCTAIVCPAVGVIGDRVSDSLNFAGRTMMLLVDFDYASRKKSCEVGLEQSSTFPNLVLPLIVWGPSKSPWNVLPCITTT